MQRTTASILAEFPSRKNEFLIPILQELQAENGVLTDASIGEVSRHLGLPVNKIYGVAAFYDQFRLTPRGEYHIQICEGSSCHLNGSSGLVKVVEKSLRVRSGTTRRDGKYSLELVTCLGGCGHGPVLRINGTYYRAGNSGMIKEILQSLKEIKGTDGTGRK